MAHLLNKFMVQTRCLNMVKNLVIGLGKSQTTGELSGNLCNLCGRLTGIRESSYRKDCSKQRYLPPKSVSLHKCDEVSSKRNPRNDQEPFKTYWENMECCVEECPDQFPRFDQLYDTTTDKRKKKYTVTWVECPGPCRLKKTCYKQGASPIPFKKRDPCERPRTACPLPPCALEKGGSCTKINICGCRPARDPPKCVIPRKKTDCVRYKTQCPSFSECKKVKIRDPAMVECRCWQYSNCQVMDALKKQKGPPKRVKYI